MSDLLKFQIQKITSYKLQRELFEALAPHMKVVWEELPGANKDRAEALSAAIRTFSNQDKRQHGELCAALGVISTIGSDARNTEFLEKEIGEAHLNDRYAFYDFGVVFGRGKKEFSRTTHNIAAWICVMAYKKPDKPEQEAEQKRAMRIWSRLAKQSVSLSEQSTSYCFFLSETTLEMSNRQRADAFCVEYKKYRTRLTGIEDYPAIADDSIHFEFVRYSINMASNPHLSVQLEEKEFGAKIDPNADNFHIDHYPDRGYLQISRVQDKDTSREIAEIFAKHALGAHIQDQKGKRYRLTQFRDRMVLEKMVMIEESRRAKDEIWVSAVDCAYLDANGAVLSKNFEYAFPFSRERDIYTNLDLGYPLATQDLAVMNPPAKMGLAASTREILSAEISFHLHERIAIGGGKYGATEKFIPVIKINVSPKKSNFQTKTKDLKSVYRDIVYDMLKKLDLLPKTAEQINLGA